ncbi:MAG: phosphotransferase enzyme family protein, partial [Chloroflexota bacterium]
RRSPLDASFLIDRPLDLISRILEPSSSELADLMRAAHTMREHLVLLPKHPPGYGMIHGDVIPTNIVLGPGGALTLLDFDFCGPGWRAFDVATFLRDARERQATDGTAFLDGYQEMRRLSGWELKALPLFMAIRSLFRLGNWGPRLDEWGTSARPAGLIARHLAEILRDLGQVTR